MRSKYFCVGVYFIMMQVKAPVIVVGCKLDLRDESRLVSLESFTAQLMQQFKEVVTCIECSAATLYQVYCFITLLLIGDAYILFSLAN